MKQNLSSLILLASIGLGTLLPAAAADTIAVEEIQPGMKGQAYTVFAGREIEAFEVEVLGVLKNFMGPQEDLVLLRLAGPKVDFTGVVMGMSGSPVYFGGRLAGALSVRFGSFAKEAIVGMTPIASMLKAAEQPATEAGSESEARPARYPLPEAVAQTLALDDPSHAYLVPIETPLVFAGFHAQTIAHFASAFTRYGMLTVAGGGVTAPERTSALQPGGAVSAALVTGDLRVAATCTITLREGDRLYACGHPLLGFGQVELPIVSTEVVATLPSQAQSFKIANLGEVIGTFEQDRRTAVVGTLGKLPTMIPVELTLMRPDKREEQQFHFQLFRHPKISPLLLSMTLMNGLMGRVEYGEEVSYRIRGRIALQGHAPVELDDMYSPSDSFAPDASFIASQVSQTFQHLFTNPFQQPAIEGIRLRLEMLPERKAATIENAWCEKTEVQPGENITLKVVVHPYRDAPRVVTLPIQIPAQAAKGELRILISDATTLNYLTQTLVLDPAFGTRLTSLDQLIALLNRARRNHRLYVSLFQRNPTLLVQDKILPSVPLSQINVLNHPQMPSSTRLFYESVLSETFQPLDLVISGSHWLQVKVR